jgi:hypothetical protein
LEIAAANSCAALIFVCSVAWFRRFLHDLENGRGGRAHL